ncbi:hypothetical protein [Actinocorallia sp. A-T 12471]|uniref:hypothetical protein n=1 Tax=Actinocorallia sp. A-T 12471 TaxID=3089813 RepID=UPI0029CBA519|nr:hypothetical protein [Actinocorallia sp. A-T 12471]MDX6742386.1 hypothetical protein [Actinocorallia sp. A-T 12471]
MVTFEVSGIEDDVDRRQALQTAGAVTAAAAATPALAALTSAWQASRPLIPGATVSRAMLDDWAAGFGIHARSFAIDPPETALSGIARDWAEMAPHLAATQPEGVGRDLAQIAGQYSRLIAMGFQQVSDRRMASRWWQTAHFHADRSGDALLSSETRSWETTYRVVEAGENLPDLHRLARSAREHAGRQPSSALMRAIGVEAEVLVRMGRASDAITTMREAEDVFERLPAGAEQGERHLRFMQSFVYSAVGAAGQAAEAQEAARAFYPRTSYPHASAQLTLHGVILHARIDPGEASKQALAVLDRIPAERRVKRVVLAARRIADAVPEDARPLAPVQELKALTA